MCIQKGVVMKTSVIRFKRHYLFLALGLFLFIPLALSGCGGASSSGTKVGTYVAGRALFGDAIDSHGNVWVANGGNGTPGLANGDSNVTELNSSGAVIGTYVAGSLPETLAIDTAGNVWIANKGNGTVGLTNAASNVMELNSSGTLIGTYAYGSNPYSIAIDPSGNVWVTNFGYGGLFPPAGLSNVDSNVQEFMGAAKGPSYFPYSGPEWPLAE
jgi:streptogramin lyase